jgi:O-succinylbenzoate synthase
VFIKKEGLTGYGECVANTGPWYNEETIVSAKHVIKSYLAPVLFERKLESPADFLEMTNTIRGNNMAVATVEMALWDLLGKMRGEPVSRLLGGEKNEVDVGVSVGIQPTPNALVETVNSYLNDGYGRIKVKIKPGFDVEYVKAIRNKFPGVKLQVDANSAYRLDDLMILKKLDAFDLLLIEQPLAHDDIIDHSKLQLQLSTPLCLDESIRTPEDARKALEIGACKIINIKAGRVRGLQKSKEIHDLCLKQKIPVWCGGMLETGIGRAFNVALASLIGFTLPGDTSASNRYFKTDIITGEFKLKPGSKLVVPKGAGVGVEVNTTVLDSYTVSREMLKSY